MFLQPRSQGLSSSRQTLGTRLKFLLDHLPLLPEYKIFWSMAICTMIHNLFIIFYRVLFIFFRDVHDRHVRNFGSKLNNVYTLLCYIYHLRTRDLRTRVSKLEGWISFNACGNQAFNYFDRSLQTCVWLVHKKCVFVLANQSKDVVFATNGGKPKGIWLALVFPRFREAHLFTWVLLCLCLYTNRNSLSGHSHKRTARLRPPWLNPVWTLAPMYKQLYPRANESRVCSELNNIYLMAMASSTCSLAHAQ